MAKDTDQTQETEDDTTAAAEVKEDTTAVDKAVKTSEDFDKLVDENPEDVEETPSEDKDDKSKDSKDSETKDDTKADDKDTGKDEDEDSEKKDDKDTKDATDTGESNISKELAQKAFDIGLNEEEISQFGSDEELEKMVGVIESVMSEEDEKVNVTQKTDDTKTEDDKSKIKFEKEDEIDPEIVKGFRSLEQENKELRDKVDGLVGGIEQQRTAEFTKRFDGYVNGLGKEFADTFGIGSTNDLGKRSMAFKNRNAVRGRMRAFAKGMYDESQEIPDEKQLFDIALTSLHKKKIETVNGLRSSKKNATYAKGARVGRSATKKTGKMTGDQKAIATSKAFDELIDTTETYEDYD